MATIHLPPSKHPRELRKRDHFSVPVSISLAKQAGWTVGERKSIFRVVRLNFLVQQKCISRHRLVVPVPPGALFPISRGRRQGALFQVADIESTLRNLVSDPGLLVPLAQGLRKFEKPDGAVTQRNEVHAFVAGMMVGKFAGLPSNFPATSVQRVIKSPKAVQGPGVAAFVRMEAELYLSYIDFLRVDFTVGNFGLVRRSRRKSPKHTTKYHIARPNEIDMAGLPLGRLSFWAPDFLLTAEGLETNATADPLQMVRSGECKRRPYLGRGGYPPAPTLYQLSNAAFRLRRDSLARAVLNEAEVMRLPQEDGPDTIWFPGAL